MNVLSITVRDRTGVLFQGEGKAVSGKNEKGPFDVLPGHANFLSLIDEEVVLHLPSENRSFPVTRGMISAINDEVIVLLGVTAK